MLKSKKKILFQLTGSIACYKSCNLISQLVQDGHQVQAIASESALKFIGEATLEGLTGNPVGTDIFKTGKMMDHIYLARWADLILLNPATAKTINQLSAGTHDGLIGSIFLANNFKRPYIIVPAMNHEMYSNPITQSSLSNLKNLGVVVVDPEEGSLACGESGKGRLADSSEVLEILKGISL